jgi:predicted regulator of Ras-like GTPase activity (Roadblock/LC7/MglB family)
MAKSGQPFNRNKLEPTRFPSKPRAERIYTPPMLEPSLALYGETFDKVDALLGELLGKSHARYALIIDLKGFVLAHQKALWAPKPPSLDSLATLVASNYSANLAIAKLFGEQGFKEMVQQGDDIGIYAQELAEKALLITVFDNASALGRVKLFSKKAVEAIQQALSENKNEPAPVMAFDDDWRDSTQALLDGLFGSEK